MIARTGMGWVFGFTFELRFHFKPISQVHIRDIKYPPGFREVRPTPRQSVESVAWLPTSLVLCGAIWVFLAGRCWKKHHYTQYPFIRNWWYTYLTKILNCRIRVKSLESSLLKKLKVLEKRRSPRYSAGIWSYSAGNYCVFDRTARETFLAKKRGCVPHNRASR